MSAFSDDETQPVEKKCRTSFPKSKAFKFSVNDGFDALMHLAENGSRDWSGDSYPRADVHEVGPSQEHLAAFSDILKALFKLAPNGRPEYFSLRDVLFQLQDLYKIFDKTIEPFEKGLVMPVRVMLTEPCANTLSCWSAAGRPSGIPSCRRW